MVTVWVTAIRWDVLIAFLFNYKKIQDAETRKHFASNVRGIAEDIDDAVSDGDIEQLFSNIRIEDIWEFGQNKFDSADYVKYCRVTFPVCRCGWCDKHQISRYKKALCLPSGKIKKYQAIKHLEGDHPEIGDYVKYVILHLYHVYIIFMSHL